MLVFCSLPFWLLVYTHIAIYSKSGPYCNLFWLVRQEEIQLSDQYVKHVNYYEETPTL